MKMIREEDFADEKSKRIFKYRFNYYKTGDMEYLLDMVIDEYRDFGVRIRKLKEHVFNRLIDFDGSFIIYGAGVHAGLTIDYLRRVRLNDKLICCCISENTSPNRMYRGVTIKSIDEIKDKKNHSLILVPEGAFSTEMIDNLVVNGWDAEHYILIPKEIIFDIEPDYQGDIRAVLKNKENHFVAYGNHWYNTPFRSLMRGAKRHYDFTIPELGRNVHEDLRYVTSLENLYIVVFDGLRKRKVLEAGVPEEKIIQLCNLDEILYFDEDIVPEHIDGEKEVFIDGGSLNLYSSGAFMRWCNYECDRVIAFEPDPRCVNICECELGKMYKLQQVTQLVSKGLWREERELTFNEDVEFGASSFILDKEGANGNKYTIPTTSIDIIANGDPVTFIKMDIEGAELEALKGAEQTIRKYHPKLAISIYHKPEDIVELPQFIKNLDSSYNLFLRNYHMDNTETVLYAF